MHAFSATWRNGRVDKLQAKYGERKKEVCGRDRT